MSYMFEIMGWISLGVTIGFALSALFSANDTEPVLILDEIKLPGYARYDPTPPKDGT